MIGALIALLAPLSVTAEPFPGLEQPVSVGCAELIGGVILRGPEAFGGLSALTVDADGDALLALSDAAWLFSADVETRPDGAVAALRGVQSFKLHDRQGRPLNKMSGDAEAMALLGDELAISYEGRNQIVSVNGDVRQLAPPTPPAEEDRPILKRNSGFEALVAMGDGTLIAVSEGVDEDGLAIVRRGRLGQAMSEWARTAYRPTKDLAVTAADLDPLTADLFVLERAFSPLQGPRARLKRVDGARLGDEVLEGEEVARLGLLQGIDNMEGLSLVARTDGSLRAYLVSDDNYSALQRTVLLTLAIPPGCGSPAAQARAGTDAPAQEVVDEQEGG